MNSNDSFHKDAEKWIKSALIVAKNSVANGGGPFGAILVNHNTGDEVTVYLDNNHVTENNDPTAHAEVSVIRKACKAEDTFSLEGWTLYSSCEPCPMCLASSLWARVDAVVFAADRHDAAEAGFDDLAFYERMGITGMSDFSKRFDHPDKLEPFEAWNEKADRTDY